MTDTTPVAPLVPFNIGSRPQERFSFNLTSKSNLSSGGSFEIIQIPATGWLRRVRLVFTASYTTSAAAAVVAGDAPFNLISGITVLDPNGNPIVATISGYNLYLCNKYLSLANIGPSSATNPHYGPRFAYSASGTSGTATFALDVEFEMDPVTGYGCLPALDSNSAIQLRVDYATTTVAFTGGTASAATISGVGKAYYWASVADTLGGNGVQSRPLGAGDYASTYLNTYTVSASTENQLPLTAKGGLIQGIILVSRNSGARTAFTAGSNLGLRLDNVAIREALTVEDIQDEVRRSFNYFGTDLTTSYAPLTAGVASGLDSGVIPILPWTQGGGSRATWLRTNPGSTLQAVFTPGSSATSLEVITRMISPGDRGAFYSR